MPRQRVVSSRPRRSRIGSSQPRRRTAAQQPRYLRSHTALPISADRYEQIYPMHRTVAEHEVALEESYPNKPKWIRARANRKGLRLGTSRVEEIYEEPYRQSGAANPDVMRSMHDKPDLFTGDNYDYYEALTPRGQGAFQQVTRREGRRQHRKQLRRQRMRRMGRR